jgi:hypothetical protein
MVSPLSTLSPGDFTQDTIFPSVMVELSAGMKTSLIMEAISGQKITIRICYSI